MEPDQTMGEILDGVGQRILESLLLSAHAAPAQEVGVLANLLAEVNQMEPYRSTIGTFRDSTYLPGALRDSQQMGARIRSLQNFADSNRECDFDAACTLPDCLRNLEFPEGLAAAVQDERLSKDARMAMIVAADKLKGLDVGEMLFGIAQKVVGPKLQAWMEELKAMHSGGDFVIKLDDDESLARTSLCMKVRLVATVAYTRAHDLATLSHFAVRGRPVVIV